MPFNPWGAFQAHEARLAQAAQNTARLALAAGWVETTGWGEFEMPDEIEFGLTFIEEPTIAYGYSLDGDALVPLRFPRAWGGVTQWSRDTDGFYTGAHVFVVVDTRSPEDIADVPELIPDYALRHCFTFSGIALKQLPADLLATEMG